MSTCGGRWAVVTAFGHLLKRDTENGRRHVERYTIIRFFQDGRDSEVQTTGLSLEAAQAHCRSTESLGPDWFEGYDLERHWQ